MRKFMTKEVTKTTVKVAKMVVGENGQPTVEPMADFVMLGNVSQEKAQKEAVKRYGQGVTVFGVEVETNKYKLAVEEFLEIATLVQEGEEEEEI